jgi:hypothetical protein
MFSLKERKKERKKESKLVGFATLYAYMSKKIMLVVWMTKSSILLPTQCL